MHTNTSTEAWFSVSHLKWARLWLLMGLLLITCVFYASFTSRGLPLPRIPYGDKLLHMSAYAVLMGWFVQIFHHHKGRLCIAGLFIAMGIAIEFLQDFYFKRHFDVIDMLANTVGVALALLAGMTWLDSILVAIERAWVRRFGHAS